MLAERESDAVRVLVAARTRGLRRWRLAWCRAGLRLLVACARCQPLCQVFNKTHVEISGGLFEVAIRLGKDR